MPSSSGGSAKLNTTTPAIQTKINIAKNLATTVKDAYVQRRASIGARNSRNAAAVAEQNALNHQWAMEAMEFNRAEAQKNRDFQKEMSNTAYQRAVADMKKAGINPILAATNGGRSTPGGGQATGTARTANAASVQANTQDMLSTILRTLLGKYGGAVIEKASEVAGGFGEWVNGLAQAITGGTKSTNDFVKTTLGINNIMGKTSAYEKAVGYDNMR